MPAPSCRQQPLGGAAACWIDAFCHQTLATRLPTWYANAVTSLPFPLAVLHLSRAVRIGAGRADRPKRPYMLPSGGGAVLRRHPDLRPDGRAAPVCSAHPRAKPASRTWRVACRGGVLFAGLGKWWPGGVAGFSASRAATKRKARATKGHPGFRVRENTPTHRNLNFYYRVLLEEIWKSRTISINRQRNVEYLWSRIRR